LEATKTERDEANSEANRLREEVDRLRSQVSSLSVRNTELASERDDYKAKVDQIRSMFNVLSRSSLPSQRSLLLSQPSPNPAEQAETQAQVTQLKAESKPWWEQEAKPSWKIRRLIHNTKLGRGSPRPLSIPRRAMSEVAT